MESIAAVVFSRELSMSNRWDKVKHSWYEVVDRGEDCRVDSTLHCVEHRVEMKEGTHAMRDGQ